MIFASSASLPMVAVAGLSAFERCLMSLIGGVKQNRFGGLKSPASSGTQTSFGAKTSSVRKVLAETASSLHLRARSNTVWLCLL